MRRLLMTLMAALALGSGAMGCNHAQKWHECGGSEPMCSSCAAAPTTVVADPVIAEIPKR